MKPSSKKTCAVCGDAPAKYKCPTCYLPYCSLACNKTHKQTPCSPPPPSHLKLTPYRPKPLPPSADEHGDDTNPLLTEAQRSALEHHKEVQHKMRDDRIRLILRRIDRARDREKALEQEMKDDDFVEFCDDILRAIGEKPQLQAPVKLEDLLRQQL